MNLHTITDAIGRPITFVLSAGQVSDYARAAALSSELPQADRFIADRGTDIYRVRNALRDRQIKPRIPNRKQRTSLVETDKGRQKRRNRIEFMFGRQKD
ncbi:MAG: hypothetical protein EA339_06490 [Rhodobacteraceae bacterium]|nr:MAG: hypothetical protein EA339_06490 [Paracoccaceae bacterium]